MGEDDLIQRTFAPLAAGFPGALGLRDDCAVLTPPAGHDLVLTTDAVAEGVHFFAGDGAHDIAWKALAVNVSDLIAKGAQPIAYLLSLSLPDEPERGWLDAFAAGLADAQSAFSISLAGGDTDRRPGPLSVTIAAFGSVPHGRMVRRDGARAGDRLFVSGTIGDSALGLRMRLDPGLAIALGLDAARVAPLLAHYLRPQPPLALAPHILEFASAAMDISDGLIKDCGRLARVSGVAAQIEGARVPLSVSARAVISADPDLFRTVVTGGDDYQVLAAVAADRADAFRAAAQAVGVAVTDIGGVGHGTGLSVTALDGQPMVFKAGGWDHFPARRGD
ncbi:thiamine-phosphate kinase [Hyphomicrobium sp.]|uniref:thiamine-phosphate kinase n=1 Tax=Hyphomicrobium sp. TaxID=82 RepID=UPI003F70FBB6